jgi:predicted metal-dependent HD superfamily phosphohydrolase
LDRWAEPHRRYHTTEHLRAVLGHLDWLGEPPPSATLAAFYHDAVYRPQAGDNEAASADLAHSTLHRLSLHPDLVSEVVRLVLITAHHAPRPDDRTGALLCDADLAVLGGRPDAYARYRDAVRDEYAFLDESAWRAGRSRVLEGLLARPALYATSAGRDRWEASARYNIKLELDELTGSQRARR